MREKGQSLRTLGKGNSSNDVWPNPGVQLLQQLIEVTSQEPRVTLIVGGHGVARGGQPAWELWQTPSSFDGKLKVSLGAAYHHVGTPLSAEPARAERDFAIHCWKNGQIPSNSQQSQCLPQNFKLNPASLLLGPLCPAEAWLC